MNGDQEVLPPKKLSLAGGNEQENYFNVGGILKEPIQGNSNAVESIQDPNLESGFENRGGDIGINYAEDSGKIFSLSSFRSDFNLGRPNKGVRRHKPRNGNLSRCAISSPVYDQRPRKRSREDMEFSFDLNKKANTPFHDSSTGDSQNNNSSNLVASVDPVVSHVVDPPFQNRVGTSSGREEVDVSVANE
ncbi:hypothetical protein Hanom_Chr17g01580741 [Helianthus anomalus]